MLNSLLKNIVDRLLGTSSKTDLVQNPGCANMSRDILESFKIFIGETNKTVYAEDPAEPHISITREYLDIAIDKFNLNGNVLDVGCGQGLALERMIARGLNPLGITLGEDYRICLQKQLPVLEMDLNLMTFPAESFDGIWCRHSLEHSIAPYFIIHQMWYFLKSGGLCYVEVPAPDTPCHHETNKNHYSVFTISMWLSLFDRVKFQLLEARTITFNTEAGEDTYYSMFFRK